MNLCVNAAQAMRETGGRLEVSLESTHMDKVSGDEHIELEAGPYVQIIVSDTGCGMDRQTLERIFEPYFTTKEKGAGSGLGLAVTHGIVKGHGGIITVQSELNRGTSFRVLLPKAENEVAREESSAIPTGDECVLFIDDEEPLVQLGMRMLKELGYQVTGATNPIDALNVFVEDPKRFDIVLTDVIMRNMRGEALAQKIKRIRPDIPVILFTGYSAGFSEDQAIAKGINGFLLKPLLMRELAKCVRNALDNKSVD
jgi:CheY-like chemotaxis protein